jgi:hypothetical protein
MVAEFEGDLKTTAVQAIFTQNLAHSASPVDWRLTHR